MYIKCTQGICIKQKYFESVTLDLCFFYVFELLKNPYRKSILNHFSSY